MIVDAGVASDSCKHAHKQGDEFAVFLSLPAWAGLRLMADHPINAQKPISLSVGCITSTPAGKMKLKVLAEIPRLTRRLLNSMMVLLSLGS